MQVILLVLVLLTMFSFFSKAAKPGLAFKDIVLKPVANGRVVDDARSQTVSELFKQDTVIFVVRRAG
jgi:hypothetical protein